MADKHKKNITDDITAKEMLDTIAVVGDMITKLEPKQQHIMTEWLDVWRTYLGFEKTFIPAKLKYYKRGDIVLANFGFNVGSELGGAHYAVVVENNNNNASNTLVVVPLSSLADGKAESNLHKSEVYLGKILPGSDKLSYAMPLQIRTISKLRIIKPKTKNDSQYRINGSQLQMIDNKVMELFTKPRQDS